MRGGASFSPFGAGIAGIAAKARSGRRLVKIEAWAGLDEFPRPCAMR